MNKTEEPTPKRKREAREQGQVALSTEFTGVAVLVSAMAVLVFWLGVMLERLVGIVRESVALASRPDLGSQHIGPFVAHGLGEVAWMLFPLLGAVFVMAAFITFVQVGPLFTVEPLMPELDKLNPVQGFSRLVGRDRLVELGKHIGKLTVMACIGAWTMVAWLPDILAMVRVRLADGLLVLRGAIVGVSFSLIGGLLLFGLLDFIWQRYRHHESLKMTKREVEDEHKAAEGDPEMAGKRKQMHREMINETGRPEDVRDADAVVVNPTHVAVGLKYVAEEMAAPEIVASGRGVRARAMKSEARKFQVPIIHNVKLARSLYQEGELHEAIPPDYYEPVAEVLKYAYSLGGEE